MKRALIVHGGCGTPPSGEEAERNASCERAADAGWKVLLADGSALDAVEAAVRALEDEPLLNAGTGAYLQADGVARLDASIMADDGRAGAVAQVPLLPHPVSLARYLLEQDAHVMLAGPEALTLAVRLGHATGVVATEAKIAYWQEHLDDACRRLDYAAMAAAWKSENPRLGTVGCVASDARGHLAAATSTGGTGQCYPGRVEGHAADRAQTPRVLALPVRAHRRVVEAQVSLAQVLLPVRDLPRRCDDRRLVAEAQRELQRLRA